MQVDYKAPDRYTAANLERRESVVDMESSSEMTPNSGPTAMLAWTIIMMLYTDSVIWPRTTVRCYTPYAALRGLPHQIKASMQVGPHAPTSLYTTQQIESATQGAFDPGLPEFM